MCRERKKDKKKYKVTYRVREVYVGVYECASKTFSTYNKALKWVEKNKIKNYKIEKIKRSSNDAYML
jgi:hypothetical protein